MSVKHIIPSFKAFYKAPCEKEMHQIIHGEDNYNYFEDGDDLFVQCGKQTQCLDRHHPYDRYSVSHYSIPLKNNKFENSFVLSNLTRDSKITYKETSNSRPFSRGTAKESVQFLQRGFIDMAEKLNDLNSKESKEFFSNKKLLKEAEKFKLNNPDTKIYFTARQSSDINGAKMIKVSVINSKNGSMLSENSYYNTTLPEIVNECLLRSALSLLTQINDPKSAAALNFTDNKKASYLVTLPSNITRIISKGISLDEIIKMSEKQ